MRTVWFLTQIADERRREGWRGGERGGEVQDGIGEEDWRKEDWRKKNWPSRREAGRVRDRAGSGRREGGWDRVGVRDVEQGWEGWWYRYGVVGVSGVLVGRWGWVGRWWVVRGIEQAKWCGCLVKSVFLMVLLPKPGREGGKERERERERGGEREGETGRERERREVICEG